MARRRKGKALFWSSLTFLLAAGAVVAGVVLLLERSRPQEVPPHVHCEFWPEESEGPILAGEPIWVVFEISNRSDRAVTFVSGVIPTRDYISPAGGSSRLADRFFDVQWFDEPVAYIGRTDNTEAPTPLRLLPGQAMHFRMDLEPSYEMFREGIYEIRASGPAVFRDDDGNEIPVTFQTVPSKVVVERRPY